MSKGSDYADRKEFGTVSSYDSLDPDNVATPSQQTRMQREVNNSDGKGYFEKVTPGALDGGLHIGNGVKDKTSMYNDWSQDQYGADLKLYEAGYRAYMVPYRETLRAEGRVKDLSTAGAPLSPEEFMQRDPKVAAQYQAQLKGDKKTAFHDLGTAESTMVTSIQTFGGLQHTMISAIASYNRISDKLAQKRVQARKDAATARIQEIDQLAQTLADITAVTMSAASWMGEVEVVLAEGAPFSEIAEGPDDFSHLPQSNNPDWEHAKLDNDNGTKESTATKGQKAAGHYVAAKEMSEQATRIVGHVQNAIKAGGGNVDLSLQSFLRVAMGNQAEYDKLQKKVEAFSKNIADLEMSQEAQDMKSVFENLSGQKMIYNATKMSVSRQRIDARRRADDFSEAVGGGETGKLAMYAAEAYQDLFEWGQLAQTQRRQLVDKQHHRVSEWMLNTNHYRYDGTANQSDYHNLKENLAEVNQQRAHLDGKLPEWHRAALSWDQFFNQHLIPGGRS